MELNSFSATLSQLPCFGVWQNSILRTNALGQLALLCRDLSIGCDVRRVDNGHVQACLDGVSIHPDIVDYVVACLRLTRQKPEILMGASPRTGVKISRLARALALVRGQDYVTVDLIKEIFLPAVAHRLVMQDPAQPPAPVLEEILRTVKVPEAGHGTTVRQNGQARQAQEKPALRSKRLSGEA